MATSPERLKILQMIREGKITADEGVKLLEALGEVRRASPTATMVGAGPRWLRVRVTDTNTGKVRVNVRLPVNVLTAGAKMGARFSPEVEGLDMNQLLTMVRAGMTGQVVDVFDDKDGERVEVFLE
ncbi:MAG: hypothetical protein KA988_03230 [Longilinea sp.]|nr:hypothetical protein [Longilinea sp.]MCA1954694.1 hypothetical protein [Anaerolinea sp.]